MPLTIVGLSVVVGITLAVFVRRTSLIGKKVRAFVDLCFSHLYNIKRGRVSVRTSVAVGVASSVANDVAMRMTSS